MWKVGSFFFSYNFGMLFECGFLHIWFEKKLLKNGLWDSIIQVVLGIKNCCKLKAWNLLFNVFTFGVSEIYWL